MFKGFFNIWVQRPTLIVVNAFKSVEPRLDPPLGYLKVCKYNDSDNLIMCFFFVFFLFCFCFSTSSIR